MPVLPVLNHAARFQTGRAWLETKVVDDDIHILASLFNHCLRQIVTTTSSVLAIFYLHIAKLRHNGKAFSQ